MALLIFFPTPEALANAGLEKLWLDATASGLPFGLSRVRSHGFISFERVGTPMRFLTRLLEVPGIGE